jgi:hypothetical protein
MSGGGCEELLFTMKRWSPLDKTNRGRWIPVDVVYADGKIRVFWIPREDKRFIEPFFNQSVAKQFKDEIHTIARETGAGPLIQLAKDRKIQPPRGFIYHASRCGSTLLSQMLAKDPKNLVLSEVPAVDSLMKIKDRTDAEKLALFIGVIKAFSNSCIGEEERVFFKFSGLTGSGNWFPFIQAMFPRTAWIYAYRKPIDVARSNLDKPPPWIEALKEDERLSAIVGVLNSQMKTVLKFRKRAALIVDYDEILAPRFPELLLRAFDLPTTPEIGEAMQECYRWYAKREGVLWSEQKKALSARTFDRNEMAALNDLNVIYDSLKFGERRS